MIISTDLIYNLEWLVMLLFSLLILITMIVWHEYGHLLWFKLANKHDVLLFRAGLNFEIGTEDDYNILMPNEYKIMLFYGIIMGIVPLMVVYLILPYDYILLMLIPYIVGARKDLKNLWE